MVAVVCLPRRTFKLWREVNIMKSLDHPNIVRLIEVIDTEKTLYLVMEYAAGGTYFILVSVFSLLLFAVCVEFLRTRLLEGLWKRALPAVAKSDDTPSKKTPIGVILLGGCANTFRCACFVCSFGCSRRSFRLLGCTWAHGGE